MGMERNAEMYFDRIYFNKQIVILSKYAYFQGT